MARAVFLDRDGTINHDSGYVHKISQWQWLPGAMASLAALKAAGWLLLAVSNQSGIGRGLYTAADLEKLENWVNEQLMSEKAAIDGWYYCPHAPEAGCNCRKPQAGLLFQAAAKWNVDLKISWMIGDRQRDAEAGLAAGCRSILLQNQAYPEETGWAAARNVPVKKNLAEAAHYILENS